MRKNAEMLRHKWITICLEGWIYLAVLLVLFVGALLRDINLMLVLFGMLAGPFVYNWQHVAHALRQVRVERTLPARIGAGDWLEVGYEVRNASRWQSCWSMTVVDGLSRENSDSRSRQETWSVYFKVVPRHATRSTAHRVRLEQRGRYWCGPMRMSTRFPFGLLRCTQVLPGQKTLIVWPRLGRLTARWRDFRAGDLHATQQVERRQGLLEGDYHGLRDWRSGDSPRWIHWRTTARRNELMVRQFERHKNQDVALVLDLWRPRGLGETERAAVERAVSFAATVVVDVCRQGGSRLRVATTGTTPGVFDGVASTGLMHEVLDWLAVVEAEANDTLPHVLQETLGRVSITTPVWIISTRVTDLSDTERFGALWSDQKLETQLGAVRCVDVRDAYGRELFCET